MGEMDESGLRGREADAEVADDTMENARRWDALALLVGYNELSKDARSLGEKVYLRLARDHAKARYEKLGGRIEMTKETVRVVVEMRAPFIAINDHDIELMRKALADYDAKKILEGEGP